MAKRSDSIISSPANPAPANRLRKGWVSVWVDAPAIATMARASGPGWPPACWAAASVAAPSEVTAASNPPDSGFPGPERP